MGMCRDMKNCSMYGGVQCTQVFNLAGSTVIGELIDFFILVTPTPLLRLHKAGLLLFFSRCRHFGRCRERPDSGQYCAQVAAGPLGCDHGNRRYMETLDKSIGN